MGEGRQVNKFRLLGIIVCASLGIMVCASAIYAWRVYENLNFVIFPIEMVISVPLGCLAFGSIEWGRKDWKKKPENRPLIIAGGLLFGTPCLLLWIDIFRRIYS